MYKYYQFFLIVILLSDLLWPVCGEAIIDYGVERVSLVKVLTKFHDALAILSKARLTCCPNWRTFGIVNYVTKRVPLPRAELEDGKRELEMKG